MRIAVAQIRPVKGDIESNIANHKELIELAVANEVDIIIFPELSLTGYEPELSKELATNANDVRFDDFDEISDANQITIGVGAPLKSNAGVCISMILFQPGKARSVYSKKYLHADEEPFFVSGKSSVGLLNNNPKIALAICYELSVPDHAENAFENGAEVYIASVAKSAVGVDKAITRLSEIASKYSITVLMANCIGECDNIQCAGKTSAWNNKGVLLAQLDETEEGIIILDTHTQEVNQLQK